MDTGLTVRTSGEGPDVVLVHGALGDYRQWDAIGTVLARAFRVTAISRRHHWPNAPAAAGERYSYETHSDDLRALVGEIGRPVHLVGHSYGAGVVLLTTLREPRLIRNQVLIEPALPTLLPMPPDAALEHELESRAAMGSAIEKLVAGGQPREAAVALTDWLQGTSTGFAALPAPVREALLDNAATVGPTFSAPRPDVTCEMLQSIRVPTRVLRGEHTRLYYRLIAETTARCVPGASLEVIPGCAHMSIVEAPEAVAELVRRFLV